MHVDTPVRAVTITRSVLSCVEQSADWFRSPNNVPPSPPRRKKSGGFGERSGKSRVLDESRQSPQRQPHGCETVWQRCHSSLASSMGLAWQRYAHHFSTCTHSECTPARTGLECGSPEIRLRQPGLRRVCRFGKLTALNPSSDSRSVGLNFTVMASPGFGG